MGSIAEELGKKQQEISIAEFFERNKHILGFDNPQRALLTAVKEMMDNALDACEEANVLPDIYIEIQKANGGKDESSFKVICEDNGPGIVKNQIANVFGRLLYGSRFHAVRQSRGQQGIGVSAAVMYGQLTTGKPTIVRSKITEEDVAHELELILNTKKNRPEVSRDEPVIWEGKKSGVRVEITIRGKYIKGKQSPYDYLRGTAIVNPHARITFVEPDGTKTMFDRITNDIPPICKEIKPHPEGIELGTLLNMAKSTDSYKIGAFLVNEFSRISYRVAHEICEKADVSEDLKPKNITIDDAKKIIDAIKGVRIMAPQTDCLSPIGERLIKKGLRNVLGSQKPEFYVPPVTRDPKVHTGNPFIIEVGMVYGGELPKDQPIQILRFANRVPLLYQQGACATSIAVENIDWRRYGLTQPAGKGIPVGPLVVLIHVASTKVPFTSESKEAVADIPEIQEEIEKALRETARKLQIHINKEVRRRKTSEKFTIVQKVLPQIAAKSATILRKPVPVIDSVITKIMDVVWIDWNSEFTPKPPRHRVTVSIYNYTAHPKKLNFYAIIPPNTLIEKTVNPAPTIVKEASKIEWELNAIPSVQRQDITMELTGLDKDEFDDLELYVSGIDSAHVIGAQALPGDWNLEGVPETVEGSDEGEDDDIAESGGNELADIGDDDDAKTIKGGANNDD